MPDTGGSRCFFGHLEHPFDIDRLGLQRPQRWRRVLDRLQVRGGPGQFPDLGARRLAEASVERCARQVLVHAGLAQPLDRQQQRAVQQAHGIDLRAPVAVHSGVGVGQTPCGRPTRLAGIVIAVDLLVLQLASSTDAHGHAVGDALLVYPKTHANYDAVLKHLGGLKPGQSKPVPSRTAGIPSEWAASRNAGA